MMWEVLVQFIEINTLQYILFKRHLLRKLTYVTLRLTVHSAVSCLIYLDYTIAISVAMQAVFNTDPGSYYATILGTITYQYRVSRAGASAASQHCEAS